MLTEEENTAILRSQPVKIDTSRINLGRYRGTKEMYTHLNLLALLQSNGVLVPDPNNRTLVKDIALAFSKGESVEELCMPPIPSRIVVAPCRVIKKRFLREGPAEVFRIVNPITGKEMFVLAKDCFHTSDSAKELEYGGKVYHYLQSEVQSQRITSKDDDVYPGILS